MGVPALFRWLSQKYPKIITQVIEEKPVEVDGQSIPIDWSKPNPNPFENDNLYLDMNGIVHPCSHPEDRPPPTTEEEMMVEIFKYTERLVRMVRPRKVLFIAVDGVAPRAKMNQQRSRRFRSAKEAQEKDEDKAELIKLLKQQNGGVIEESVLEAMHKKTWDSNSITPGTPFMDILAASLKWWCAYKLNTDPAWANLKIILSDASVPGEGEHKIMEFVRSQRTSQEYDANTSHVICGLDADLIMLGLATHEPHFRVLREDVFFNDAKPNHCRICGQPGHMAAECRGEAKKKNGDHDEKEGVPAEKPHIWLHVNVLREYLEIEMDVPKPRSFEPDIERGFDDWVFMCFFVGNDFLPHLPSLDIREAGIDTLITIWRENINLMGGYVTKDGHVDLQRARFILEGLAKQEDAIFKRRRQQDQRQEANSKRRKMERERQSERQSGGSTPSTPGVTLPVSRWNVNQTPVPISQLGSGSKPDNPITHNMVVNRGDLQVVNAENKSAAAVMRERLLGRSPQTNMGASTTDSHTLLSTDGSPSVLGKRKVDELYETEAKAVAPTTTDSQKEGNAELSDTVRLWEDGYADRYYEQKFHVSPTDQSFRHKVANAYVTGLQWVLLYYFQGCADWSWYYPYHYAPFAADFVDIENAHTKFVRGNPAKPFEQLMAVLPAASNHAIPKVYHTLMVDEESPIIDFYPTDFEVDLNGKKFEWQGVALLPFINKERLLAAMADKTPLLSPEEAKRNELGSDQLLFSEHHPLFENIAANFYSKREGAPKYKLNAKTSDSLLGKVAKDPSYIPQSALELPMDGWSLPSLEEDHSMRVFYEMPQSSNVHKSMLLRGVELPQRVLDQTDIIATQNRTRNPGRAHGGGQFRGGHRGSRNGNGHGREQIDYSNPFAAHLDPRFAPPPALQQNGWSQANPVFGHNQSSYGYSGLPGANISAPHDYNQTHGYNGGYQSQTNRGSANGYSNSGGRNNQRGYQGRY